MNVRLMTVMDGGTSRTKLTRNFFFVGYKGFRLCRKQRKKKMTVSDTLHKHHTTRKNDDVFDDFDRCFTCVIDRRLYFGGFPRVTHINFLLQCMRRWKKNVLTIIDMTTPDERQQHHLQTVETIFRDHAHSSSFNHETNFSLHHVETRHIDHVLHDHQHPSDVHDDKDNTICVHYINFPIRDHSVPEDRHNFLEFMRFLVQTYEKNGDNGLFLIHCRGGHGRSPMLTAVFLYLVFHYPIPHIIDHLTHLHHMRRRLHPRYMSQLCPVTSCQRRFLFSLCQ